MQIRELMNTEVQTVSPDALVTDVAKMMRAGDFGVVPVCQGDQVIGMITDRDIVVRAVADAKDIKQCRVQDVMTSDVVTVCDTDDVDDVQQLMSERQIRRVAVVDQADHLCGIVSLGDLAQRDETRAGVALGEISEPQHREPQQHH